MKKIAILLVSLFCIFSANIKIQAQQDGNNYVKIQFVQPLGEYKDFYNSGFGAEFGRMFPLNFDIADGLIMPGIDITFISTQFNSGKNYDYKFGKTHGGLLWDLGVKLGPMITIGITDGLVADFAIQYDPTVVLSLGRKGKTIEALEGKDQSASSVSFAHRVSLKGDIRYTHFLFGLEFVLGSTTMHYNHKIIPTSNPTDEISMGLGTLLLNFGFTF